MTMYNVQFFSLNREKSEIERAKIKYNQYKE